jgi:hypothetical protein
MNNNLNNITILGLSVLALYSIAQILSFFSVSKNTYNAYLLFYLLLALSICILPNDYPSV